LILPSRRKKKNPFSSYFGIVYTEFVVRFVGFGMSLPNWGSQVCFTVNWIKKDGTAEEEMKKGCKL